LQVQGREAWCPRRDEAYLGVLVDDLITRGVAEPYRMFTSRAEYRLSLREDNADLRLTEQGRELGLVDDVRWAAFCAKREAIERETARLKATWAHPTRIPAEAAERVVGKALEREYTFFDLLRRPNVRYADLMTLPTAPETPETDAQVVEQLEIAAQYQGYIDRQLDEVARTAQAESTLLPLTLDYSEVRGLSKEVQQKLAEHRPETIGQAGRIQGVTPAAISLLLVYLKRKRGAAALNDEVKRA
ncbi:MAG TPA: tRNA uridine-5-carboxymethylaminomethyl(34) synthesis enzyme MnmG, partial [Denitromonas sp.]|nr:tRNA uridine-5-carboxymethylaminomethyl(34) synthesis enzyme MnmG [Denitromonas sp.]